jgi:hypothetical protein
MEPLHPELRQALKQAHPGLTDEDIDRFEELLAQRAAFDPVAEADEIARLDRERVDLMKRLMPHYAEVARAFTAQIRRREGPERSNVRIAIKRPKA